MADLIPWMNVGAAWRRLTGDTSRGDEDILPWISKNGGARDFKFSSPAPGVVSFQGDVKPGWEANGKGGYSQVSKKSNTPVNETGTSNVQQTSAPDPVAVLRAQNDNKARQVKDRLLGRSGEIDAILNDIMGRVDGLLADRKTKRQGQYDSDSAALIDALNAAIPEIQKAFASLGLSSSTFVGDRVDNTNKEYEKSQSTVDETFNNDLASYGAWAESEKGNARANAEKARNTMNFVRDADANADNLGRFQESELSFNNALTDFGNARNQYTTSGDALKKLESIGSDYDFSKIMDSFGSLAASSANTGTGGGAAKAVADSIRGIDPKNKKKLTEAQVNNPVGASAA